MEVKNKVAIISGGASGMGAATAVLLTAAGAKVAILDINSAAANKLAQSLKCLPIACDITDSQQVETALQTIRHQLGPIHICINCAGIIKSKRIVTPQGPLPLNEFRQVIEVNLIGTFNLMRIAAAEMSLSPLLPDTQERGVIINTASIAAFEGQIGQAAYSASKGGIVSLTLPAARELAQFGIRVMAIAPGLVDTPLFQSIPEKAKQALANEVPFPKRLATPEEYASLVLHIINNPMLNGEVIRLDGALRMAAK